MSAVTLTAAETRSRLVAHLGLARPIGHGARGVRAVLDRLRCIQLDPLDAIGTNADLVVMARVDGVQRGELWRHLFPRHAFEHFAKERCILPASAFPWYRAKGHAAGVSWWRHHEREARVPHELVAAVLEEIRARGPVTARGLTDHGSVRPIDWSGWTGTAKATSMALEILWTRCDVVVAGRDESGAKLYDVPERALGEEGRGDGSDGFDRWALRERVEAAGMLARAGGSTWSMLSDLRQTGLVQEMIATGEILEMQIEGSRRPYLATPAFLAPRRIRFDDRARILGPLDPLLWDRKLVRSAFDFDYVWEVYKPADRRVWGWYVCPLLHRDRLVGRMDARVEDGTFVVRKLWLEGETVDVDAIRAAVERHAGACKCHRVRWPRKWR